MHFALPPRKTSHPPPYVPRSTRLPGLRKTRLKLIALAGLAFLALIYLTIRASSSGHAARAQRAPRGNPPVVLVTVLDHSKYTKAYLDAVKENRRQYAEKHGYQTLIAQVGDYDLKGAPFSWTAVPAMRHALSKYRDCHYAWYLDANSFIMNPKLKVEEHIMQSSRLDELMKKDFPVVPPDSIIKTFSHLKGQDVDFVITQDKDGLSPGSLIVRNGDWAKFFLETWFDPLYRSYNFQKAEKHALEHIVQWHPTILARMAIIDQRLMNAYNKGAKEALYQNGDLAVRFPDCEASGGEACEAETESFVQAWRRLFEIS